MRRPCAGRKGQWPAFADEDSPGWTWTGLPGIAKSHETAGVSRRPAESQGAGTQHASHTNSSPSQNVVPCAAAAAASITIRTGLALLRVVPP